MTHYAGNYYLPPIPLNHLDNPVRQELVNLSSTLQRRQVKCREVNDSTRDTLQTGELRVESGHASLGRRTPWSTWRCSLRPLGHPDSRVRSLAEKKSVWRGNLRKQRKQARGRGGTGPERGMQRLLTPLLQLRSFSVRPNCSSRGRHTGEPEPAKSCRREIP